MWYRFSEHLHRLSESIKAVADSPKTTSLSDTAHSQRTFRLLSHHSQHGSLRRDPDSSGFDPARQGTARRNQVEGPFRQWQSNLQQNLVC